MTPKTIRFLISRNKLLLILNLSLSFNPFYKLSFAHAAAESGLLGLLSRGPMSLDRIVAEISPESESREVLQALLRLGIRLRQVKKTRKGYSLKGLSRKLAMQQNVNLDFTSMLALEWESQQMCWTSPETAEGMRAYQDGRPPELTADTDPEED